mmetsp:Transcript_294/g.433  ORF Transcript_294/g.433 Transcript_294/m.433 type:complete len:2253 (+) Transcript_294:1749-8507(+)
MQLSVVLEWIAVRMPDFAGRTKFDAISPYTLNARLVEISDILGNIRIPNIDYKRGMTMFNGGAAVNEITSRSLAKNTAEAYQLGDKLLAAGLIAKISGDNTGLRNPTNLFRVLNHPTIQEEKVGENFGSERRFARDAKNESSFMAYWDHTTKAKLTLQRLRKQSIEMLDGKAQLKAPFLLNGSNWAKSIAAPIVVLVRLAIRSLPRRAMNELQLNIEQVIEQETDLAEQKIPGEPLQTSWIIQEIREFGAFALSSERARKIDRRTVSQLNLICGVDKYHIGAFEHQNPWRPHVIILEDLLVKFNNLTALSNMSNERSRRGSKRTFDKKTDITEPTEPEMVCEELTITGVKLRQVWLEIRPSFANVIESIMSIIAMPPVETEDDTGATTVAVSSELRLKQSYTSVTLDSLNLKFHNPGHPTMECFIDDITTLLSSVPSSRYRQMSPSFIPRPPIVSVMLHFQTFHFNVEDCMSFHPDAEVKPAQLFSWKMTGMSMSLMDMENEEASDVFQTIMAFDCESSTMVANIGNLGNISKLNSMLDPFLVFANVLSSKKTSPGEGRHGGQHHAPIFVHMDPTVSVGLGKKDGDDIRLGISKRKQSATFWKIVNTKESKSTRQFSGVLIFRESLFRIALFEALVLNYSISHFWLSISRPKSREFNVHLKVSKGTTENKKEGKEPGTSGDGNRKLHSLELLDYTDPTTCIFTSLPSVCTSAFILSSAKNADELHRKSRAQQSRNGDSASNKVDIMNKRVGSSTIQIRGKIAMGKIHQRVEVQDLFSFLKSDSKIRPKFHANIAKLTDFFRSPSMKSDLRASSSMSDAKKALTNQPSSSMQAELKVSFALYLQGIQCDLSSKQNRDSNYILSLSTGKFKLTVGVEHNFMHDLKKFNSHFQSTQQATSQQSPSDIPPSFDTKLGGEKRYYRENTSYLSGTLETKESEKSEIRGQVRKSSVFRVEIGFEGLQATLRREMSDRRSRALNKKNKKLKFNVNENGDIMVETSNPIYGFEDTLRMHTSLRLVAMYDSGVPKVKCEIALVDTIITVGDNVFSTYRLLVAHLNEMQTKLFKILRSSTIEVDNLKSTFRDIQKQRGEELGQAIDHHSLQTEKEFDLKIDSPRLCILLSRESSLIRSKTDTLKICHLGFQTLSLFVKHRPNDTSGIDWHGAMSDQHPISGKVTLQKLGLRFLNCSVVKSMNIQVMEESVPYRSQSTLVRKALPLAIFHELKRKDRIYLERLSCNSFVLGETCFDIGGRQEKGLEVKMSGSCSGLDLVADPEVGTMMLNMRRFMKKIFQKIVYENAEEGLESRETSGHELKEEKTRKLVKKKSSSAMHRVESDRSNGISSTIGVATENRDRRGSSEPNLKGIAEDQSPPVDSRGDAEENEILEVKERESSNINIHFELKEGKCFLLQDSKSVEDFKGESGVLEYLLQATNREERSKVRPISFRFPSMQLIMQRESQRHKDDKDYRTGFCLVDVWLPDQLSFRYDIVEFWKRCTSNMTKFENTSASKENADAVFSSKIYSVTSAGDSTPASADKVFYDYDFHVTVHPIEIRLYSTTESNQDGIFLLTTVKEIYIYHKEECKDPINSENSKVPRRGKSKILKSLSLKTIAGRDAKEKNPLSISQLTSVQVADVNVHLRMNRKTVHSIRLKIKSMLGKHASVIVEKKKDLELIRLEIQGVHLDVNVNKLLLGSLMRVSDSLSGGGQLSSSDTKDEEIKDIEQSRIERKRKKQALADKNLLLHFGDATTNIKIHEFSDKEAFQLGAISSLYITKTKDSTVRSKLYIKSLGLKGEAVIQNQKIKSLVHVMPRLEGFDIRINSSHSVSYAMSPRVHHHHSNGPEIFFEDSKWRDDLPKRQLRNTKRKLTINISLKPLEFKVMHISETIFLLTNVPHEAKYKSLKKYRDRSVELAFLQLEMVKESRKVSRKCHIGVVKPLFLTIRKSMEKKVAVLAKSFSDFLLDARKIAKKSVEIDGNITTAPTTTRQTLVRKESANDTSNAQPFDSLKFSAENLEIHVVAGDMIMGVQLKDLGVQLEIELVKMFESLRKTKNPRIKKSLLMWVGPRAREVRSKVSNTDKKGKEAFSIYRRWDLRGIARRSDCINVPGFYVKLCAEEDAIPPLTGAKNVEVQNCDIILDGAILVSHLNDIYYLRNEFWNNVSSNSATSRTQAVKKENPVVILCTKDNFEFNPRFEISGGLTSAGVEDLRGLSRITGMNFMRDDMKDLILPVIYNSALVGIEKAIKGCAILLEVVEDELR